MIIQMIKELRAIKKRERVYKGIEKLKQYCDEMVADGNMSREKRENLLMVSIDEYLKMFNT